jgi:acetylornithine/succinyldiaminopimelate/putrescine aminotransferase
MVMARKERRFRAVRLSLADLLGADYVDAVAAARAELAGEPVARGRALGRRKVDFFPLAAQRAMAARLPDVGRRIAAARRSSPPGASTRMFAAATNTGLAPLTGWGYYRVAEDGRLRLLTKSEHYHAPLGHGFEGYRLVEHARRLGIPNATHNNMRGCVTRLLEAELVRTANGLARSDAPALGRLLRSRRGGVLNRVLNLQTGSIACEAGLKMMLARFYRPQEDSPRAKYQGRVPAIIVVGDRNGALLANYHGTTIFAQMMRGMWPSMRQAMERRGLWKVVPVRANDPADLEAAFNRYDRGRFKIAGFCHELVLMNYGGLRLERRFVRRAYELCRKHDVPTMADEIQSCLWSPELYMFREYGIRPNLVVIGKGFPGGESSASRILLDATMDLLPQFGALVTSGQEELSSLAYLVTMRWAEANREITSAVGEEYELKLHGLADRHPSHVTAVEGRRHMASIHFQDIDKAMAFVGILAGGGLDISAQTYKVDCRPCALTKLPLIAGYEVVEFVVARMEDALRRL